MQDKVDMQFPFSLAEPSGSLCVVKPLKLPESL